uniref:CUB and zona pellucida-like domains 1, tandem duplicate 1 n=1 Tax=Cyprinodon variegatus TaxID=28743 RepID=A0A3Q2G2M8_CYPVA
LESTNRQKNIRFSYYDLDLDKLCCHFVYPKCIQNKISFCTALMTFPFLKVHSDQNVNKNMVKNNYCWFSWSLFSLGNCGGYLYGSSGTFESPNYPNNYQNNLDCTWYIRPGHQFIRLQISDLDTECCCDPVDVYDGHSTSSRRVLVCNNSVSSFHSTSNYMTVLFRTDGSIVGRGFRADCYQDHVNSHLEVDIYRATFHNSFNSYLNSLGYDNNNLYLNDPYCRPQISSDNVVFNFPLNTCGNIKQFVNGRIVYSNFLRAWPSTHGEITRQSYLKMNVSCLMESDSVSQIYFVVEHGGNSSIIGSGRFNTTMAFYTSSSFYFQVTEFPYLVDLNQDLYVQVYLRRPDSSLVLFLDTCVASPSPFDFEYRPYYLVRDGCTSDETYRPITSGSQYRARFSFRAFQFLRGTDSVYLQCKVVICPASDLNSRCLRGCSRRVARELESEHESQTLVVGPIKLKGQLASGASITFFFGNVTDVKKRTLDHFFLFSFKSKFYIQ